MNKKINIYIGKAGQLAVMGEFLMLGWNVAIPEVDVGDDIFVVQDDKGLLKRVQVKSAIAQPNRTGYSAQFHIPISQITRLNLIEQYFVFAIRSGRQWVDFMVMPGQVVENHFIKPDNKGFVNAYFTFDTEKVVSGKKDFSVFRNNFTDFPMAF